MARLEKLKMPGKKKMDLAELDMSEESPELEMEEGEEELMVDEEAPASQDLSLLSDDELLAEVQKRGLMSQLEQSGEEEELMA